MSKGHTIIRTILATSMLLATACDLAAEGADAASVTLRSGSAATTVAGMSGSAGETWVVTQTGEVKGWGQRWCDEGGCLEPADIDPVALPGPAVEVHGNGTRTAVVLADGRVLAWGSEAADVLAPHKLALEGIVQLGLGADFACGRDVEGGVQCQGLDGIAAPGWLAGLPAIESTVDLAVGDRHACALSEDGDVVCWGSNDRGQLGSSVAAGPVAVALADEAVDVVAGVEHACALLVTGAVQCWGHDAQGRLGHAGAGVGTVPLPEAAASIAVAAEHGCAIGEASESLYCWGSDEEGQLGAGEPVAAGIRRVDLGDSHAVAVLMGGAARTTFAVLDDGGLRGWGDDAVGQAGYGDLLDGADDEAWRVGNLPDIPIFRSPK
jgi:hypothetical protein